MAKKKTTDKRLTFETHQVKAMEGIASRKGMSVKKMLEFQIAGWIKAVEETGDITIGY